MFWCFHCYAVNDHPSGPCQACGQPVEAPAGLSHVDDLIWTLGHPDADRAIVAAQILGKLKARGSVPALRQAAETGPDVYLRADALRSVLAIEDVESLRPWLVTLSRHAPFNVRAIAREALQGG
jgi:HEAT repeats